MAMRAFLHTYRKALANHADVHTFGEGLKRHGWDVYAGEASDWRGGELVVQWNVRQDGMFEKTRGSAVETCILETSYLEPRREYVSVSFGQHVNNRNRFYGPFDDPSRWEERFAHLMRPWRSGVGPIVIMGQMPGDMATKNHVNFFDWVLETYRAFAACDRIVWFRPHPGMVLPNPKQLDKQSKICVHPDQDEIWRGWRQASKEGLRVHAGPLEKALVEAGRVVTFNSNSGVDAVLAGVPTVAVDKGSMAWDVTSHELGEIVHPDREKWAHALAWKQWTRDEIAAGECWAHVCPDSLR